MATRKSIGKLAPQLHEDGLQNSAASVLSIVGIGASAGGLEAFEVFFGDCPVDTGMAFVLVPHLDPSHQSVLCEILQRITAMPVIEARDQLAVAADHVYIIPPNREMTILQGVLHISLPEQARGQRMPIDRFLRSLAEDRAERAIGVILSGTATDGTLGLRAIHGVGGVCIVQSPETAKYDGMPQSAITAGYATHILPAEKIPELLLTLKGKTVFHHSISPIVASDKVIEGIKQILTQVRNVTGHDFSLYKKSTIGRRIERRMSLHAIEDTAIYFRYLKENPGEVHHLFKELLINVTNFFRDPDAFATLKQSILPTLLSGKPAGYIFRVWVAGCASGEEAYSIAIVLQELLDELREKSSSDITIQIYATDLDDNAIAIARAGKYPPNIAQDVTSERLRRFFTKDDTGYKVKKEIREMIVFAVQNVIKDPPFTKLDLLSCRNLMIYLEPELQSRLIPTFHYALKPDGVLLLSSSESIANHAELFTALDRKWKFYRAKQTSSRAQREMSHPPRGAGVTIKIGGVAAMANKPKNINVAELSNRALLLNYAPASVTTDAEGNILYVHGDTGRYLRPAPGLMSTNIVEMAREGLPLELRSALINAVTSATLPLSREVSVKTNGGFSMVGLTVRRLLSQQPADENLLLVSFQDIAAPNPPTTKSVRRKRGSIQLETGHAELLERELAFAKESLKATIEEQQATNEELKSTNEELQSTNEELQSANEELETSKEELQSLNEEMITVNAEQNDRIEQLNDLQNDMKNLLDSTNIGTLFLDHQLCIRRYTREAIKAYRLVATDVGRPLSDIKSNLEDVDLLADLQAVLDTLIPREREVRSIIGAHYLARMQPYRTLDNVIEGAVLTFTDITESGEVGRLKLIGLQMAHQLAEGIVKTMSEPLLVLDGNLQVVSASECFYKHFGLSEEETLGHRIYELDHDAEHAQWNSHAWHQLLEDVLPQEPVINGYGIDYDFPVQGISRIVLNARHIVTTPGDSVLMVLAFVSIEPIDASNKK
jgi:two-component system CheB/CheR fusion protein